MFFAHVTNFTLKTTVITHQFTQRHKARSFVTRLNRHVGKTPCRAKVPYSWLSSRYIRIGRPGFGHVPGVRPKRAAYFKGYKGPPLVGFNGEKGSMKSSRGLYRAAIKDRFFVDFIPIFSETLCTIWIHVQTTCVAYVYSPTAALY